MSRRSTMKPFSKYCCSLTGSRSATQMMPLPVELMLNTENAKLKFVMLTNLPWPPTIVPYDSYAMFGMLKAGGTGRGEMDKLYRELLQKPPYLHWLSSRHVKPLLGGSQTPLGQLALEVQGVPGGALPPKQLAMPLAQVPLYVWFSLCLMPANAAALAAKVRSNAPSVSLKSVRLLQPDACVETFTWTCRCSDAKPNPWTFTTNGVLARSFGRVCGIPRQTHPTTSTAD
eukprot:752322-Hanusia_phi.AAC.4